MIDIASIAVSTAITMLSQFGTTYHTISSMGKKYDDVQKKIDRQQKEILAVEIVTGISVVTSFIEQQIWKRNITKQNIEFNDRLTRVETAVGYIADRMNASPTLSSNDAKKIDDNTRAISALVESINNEKSETNDG